MSTYTAAFVVGLVLVVSALIGEVIKAKEIEIPAITGRKRVFAGLFGALLMIFGASEGKLLTAGEGAPLVSAKPTARLTAADHVKVSDIKVLPNEARVTLASIKVDGGCVVLLSQPESDDDQLRICQNTPVVPAAWQTKTVRIGADCASRSARGPIAVVYANPAYDVRTWEFSFAC